MPSITNANNSPESLSAKYPAITQSWRRNWELVIPFFAFPEGMSRIIYTANAIEALNSKLRRRAPQIEGVHFSNRAPGPLNIQRKCVS